MDNENRIRIRVRDDTESHSERDIKLGARFEIPVGNRTTPLAIAGLILHAIGWILVLVAVIYASFNEESILTRYNEDPTDPAFNVEDQIVDLEGVQNLREVLGILGLLAISFIFAGFSMYTYGRTQRGDDNEVATREVIRVD